MRASKGPKQQIVNILLTSESHRKSLGSGRYTLVAERGRRGLAKLDLTETVVHSSPPHSLPLAGKACRLFFCVFFLPYNLLPTPTNLNQAQRPNN